MKVVARFWDVVLLCGCMAISLKKNLENGEEIFEISMNNSHVDSLQNIVKKYDSVENEAQALDFIIKAVGKDASRSEGVIVDGVLYAPSEYGE